MKINVASIPEEGLKVHFSRDETWFRKIFAEKEDPGFSLKDLDVSISLKRIRETLYLEGSLRTVAETVCSRCLDAATLSVSAPFKYVLAPAQLEIQEEKELNTEDLDFVFYEDDLIDLDPLIIEQIILQIPMRILCRDDCKGLCPHCGINLNTGSCQCHERQIDSRLAVLKNLKL